MQEGRLDARQEIVRFAEFGLGLPGEADDHVDTDKGIGHRLPHGGDALGKAGRGVPAAHETQDAVRTALERDVEVVLELGDAAQKAMISSVKRFGSMEEIR